VAQASSRLPALAAPTASGKTALVLRLARRWPLEVISADAMQVYRGLTIGTASPSAEERARVPHHLVGEIEPSEPFSVADFVRRAEAAILDVVARGRVPIVVGGTGFYLSALVEGLPSTPPADRHEQARIARELAADGLEGLLRELADASPVDAERAQRNPRRVVRAVEILRRTGRPPSAFETRPPRFAFEVAVILPPPEGLVHAVRARSRAMVAAGWLDEVAALAQQMDTWTTARQAIGYQALRRVLAGELALETALAEIERATLRLAKRQRTWFKRRPPAARRWYGTPAAHEGAIAEWLASMIG
jgi:tRNA dimethylallyltransferase